MEEDKEIFVLEKENINCKELETQYKQENFFKDNFNYVVCSYIAIHSNKEYVIYDTV